MQIKSLLLSLVSTFFISTLAWAQYADDAVLFSQDYTNGTARFKAMGNAQTALGGDLSAISGNPAGLGFYSQSDIGISLDYMNHLNKTGFMGNNNSVSAGRFAVSQVGVVFHLPNHRLDAANLSEGWLNFNIGIQYDRHNDYLRQQRYSGINPNNSIVNNYVDQMYLNPSSQFADDIYGMYLAEELEGNPNDFFPVVRENADKTQNGDLDRAGNKSRINLAFGANYSNKIYIGGSLGLTTVKCRKYDYFDELNGMTKSIDEIKSYNPDSPLADPSAPEFDFVEASYDLYDDFEQDVEGSGIDMTLGLLYKPTPDLNLGFTFTSPTWMTIQEDGYDGREVHYYDSADDTEPFESFEGYGDEFSYEYNIITPLKLAAGVSKLFNSGLISADIEFVDYSKTKFKTLSEQRDTQLEDDNNNDIKSLYKSAVNLRVGGEYKFDPVFSGRAGFNYYGNPYKNADQDHFLISAGLGAKLNSSLYLDLAVTHTLYNYSLNAYTLDEEHWDSPSPIINVDNNRTNVILTLGAKF